MYKHPAEPQIDELSLLFLEKRIASLDPTIDLSRRDSGRGPVRVPSPEVGGGIEEHDDMV